MITIAGAGLAGLACAYALVRRGASVTVFERAEVLGAESVARFAGGMLAPWCERESAEDAVVRLGGRAFDWWAQITPVHRRGTLVLALRRDLAEIARFGRRTSAYRTVSGAEVAALEPALAGRFQQGLFFEQEAHLDPRRALRDLAAEVGRLGGEIRLGSPAPARVDLDCRGIHAALPGLRTVRGEMALLRCPEVEINRTLRLLHPRTPIYLVPRGDGHYMLGATMVESDHAGAPTLRALMELMGAAYALSPAFAEAEVVETGAGLRPAYPDNLPRLEWRDGTLHLNGLYRHGFLLAPALAEAAADQLMERRDENPREFRTA